MPTTTGSRKQPRLANAGQCETNEAQDVVATLQEILTVLKRMEGKLVNNGEAQLRHRPLVKYEPHHRYDGQQVPKYIIRPQKQRTWALYLRLLFRSCTLLLLLACGQCAFWDSKWGFGSKNTKDALFIRVNEPEGLLPHLSHEK